MSNLDRSDKSDLDDENDSDLDDDLPDPDGDAGQWRNNFSPVQIEEFVGDVGPDLVRCQQK